MNGYAGLFHSFAVADRQQKERADALQALLDKHQCADTAALAALGQAGKLETAYAVADWRTLAWRPAELGDRPAVPLGATYMDVNWDCPPRKGAKADYRLVHLFAVLPNAQDPNLYSLHCELPLGQSSCCLEGIGDVSRLLSLNWVSGMGNGVVGFSLGGRDVFLGTHRRVPHLLDAVRSALQAAPPDSPPASAPAAAQPAESKPARRKADAVEPPPTTQPKRRATKRRG